MKAIPGPMPIPANAPIEGYPNPGTAIVMCWCSITAIVFSMNSTTRIQNNNGSWNADSAAVWDLMNDEQRPWTWTSADAAGLPIFPGLVRYDEVAAGTSITRCGSLCRRAARPLCLRHRTGQRTPAVRRPPPMGMRLRLKASYDISHFSPNVQVILTALKKYGMIMADNGSAMYLSGAPDDRWRITICTISASSRLRV